MFLLSNKYLSPQLITMPCKITGSESNLKKTNALLQIFQEGLRTKKVRTPLCDGKQVHTTK